MGRNFVEVVDKMIALLPGDDYYHHKPLKKLLKSFKVHHYITPPESSYTCWIRSTDKLVEYFKDLNDLHDWEREILDVWTDGTRGGGFPIEENKLK